MGIAKKGTETRLGDRHAIYMYINVPTKVRMLMYRTCLRPSLVSVHSYAISTLHFKFPKFFV